MAARKRLLQAQRKWTALVFAGGLGDWCAAGERGDGVRCFVGLAAVAPLGEHLGGVDLTRPWQRREDLPVRVLPEPGGDGLVEVLDRGVDGAVTTPARASTAWCSADGEVRVGGAGRAPLAAE